MENTIFWEITQCSPMKSDGSFGRICQLLLQGRRISQARNPRKTYSKAGSKFKGRYLFHACFLQGLFFDSEDGGDTFLRNFGSISTKYTGLIFLTTELLITTAARTWNSIMRYSCLQHKSQSYEHFVGYLVSAYGSFLYDFVLLETWFIFYVGDITILS
jgi:hypothetical protein